MDRKQVGMIDAALLDLVDAARAPLGQTRRIFVERALEAALRDDTQAAQVPAARAEGAATRTREKASATGPVTARGASRPVASPRTPRPGGLVSSEAELLAAREAKRVELENSRARAVKKAKGMGR
jgi:hypothetical protein